VANVSQSSFSGCTALTRVTFGGSNTSIGTSAFPQGASSNGDNLQTTYNASNPKAGTYVRVTNTNLTWYKVGSTLSVSVSNSSNEQTNINTYLGLGLNVTVTGSMTNLVSLYSITVPTGTTLNWQATVSGSNPNNPLMEFAGAGNVNVTGNITQSGTAGTGIRYNGTGTLTINSTIASSANNVYGTVWNNSSGTVNVTGGTISNDASGGIAISNNTSGTVNVSAGNINAGTNSCAILNASTGKTNISGTAVITSTVGSTDMGTIYNSGVNAILTISGGTVRNTQSDGVNKRAIQNLGTVNITGGTVTLTAPNGATSSIRNSGASAVVNFTGGTITPNNGLWN